MFRLIRRVFTRRTVVADDATREEHTARRDASTPPRSGNATAYGSVRGRAERWQ